MTHDSIAFRDICANTHPDHRTLADFRKRFLDELAGLFSAALLIAQAMELLMLGTVSLDGTKIKANARKHKTLSFGHAYRLEEPLKGKVEELLRLAEQADNTPLPEQWDIPLELNQARAGLSPIPVARPACGAGRMGTGVSGMESQAPCCAQRMKKEGKIAPFREKYRLFRRVL